MASWLKALAMAALLTASATLTAAQSGSGTTTRYWYEQQPSQSRTFNIVQGLLQTLLRLVHVQHHQSRENL